MDFSEHPTVSVIVPVYRDWRGLIKCLSGLTLQNAPFKDYEILIINNAPEEEGAASLALPRNAQVIDEKAPGSYAARNKGITESHGRILMFLDADCEPQPGWLENALTCLETRQSDLVAGHLALTYQGERLTPAECFEKAYAFRQEQHVHEGVAITANLIVRREVFDKIGLFNSELMSGGDFEWTRRATTHGYRLVYCPDAVVHHPARSSMAALAGKARRVTSGSRSLYRQQGVFGNIRRVFGNLLADIILPFNRNDMSMRESYWALLVLFYLKGVKVMQRLRLAMAPGKSVIPR